jgi:hypothetical protein
MKKQLHFLRSAMIDVDPERTISISGQEESKGNMTEKVYAVVSFSHRVDGGFPRN